MRGDTGGLLFRNQGRLSEIQRSKREREPSVAKSDATSYKGQSALNAIMGQKGQTASLKGGLTFGTTLHPFDGQAPDAEAGYETGTSIFCPVLTELITRWFSPPGGTVLDPFAGGSVRGVVSAKMGRRYIGVDMSARQIAANKEQARTICADDIMPEWRVGDSSKINEIAADIDADLILSCPPYWNLEIYSDDPNDLSNMPYNKFLEVYRDIIAKTVSRLKPNRFACFVVGDVRHKDGFYCGLPIDTVRAFEDAGARLYNWAILVTATGSLPIRAGRAFAANRKLGKTHQDCLIFCKGDWRKASEACGDVDE